MENYARINGLNLRYLDIKSSGEQRGIIALLPGVTEHANWFDFLIQTGLNNHYRVITMDLRGQAKSDKSPGEYSIDNFSADVKALLRNVLKITEPVIIGGHSLGATVALDLAAKNKDMFLKVVLIDPPAFPERGSEEPIKPGIAGFELPIPNVDSFLNELMVMPFFETGIDATFKNIFLNDISVAEDGSGTWRTTAADATECLEQVFLFPWRDRAEQLTQPTLILHATSNFILDSSPLVTNDQIDKLIACNPDLFYYEPVNANHVSIILKKHAKTVVQKITRFLTEKY